MIFDLEDRIFVVKKWYKTSSVTNVRRAFRRRDARFHGRNLPSERQIRRVVECFEKYGSVCIERSEEGLLGGLKFLPPIRTFDVCDSFLAGSKDCRSEMLRDRLE